MKFRIPFTASSLERVKKRAAFFKKFVKPKENSSLKFYLESSDVGITREEYLAVCLNGLVTIFLLLFLVSNTLLFFMAVENFFLISLGISVLFSFFIFFLRVIYPKVYSSRRQREIEVNLIPALEDMLVQLNSGIPLFSILVNISSSDYSALSEEFKKIVRKINAGLPQIEVLDEIGEKNPSLYFRRALWQISNGMRAGSDISIVVRESIHSLEEEQLIQIQNYGNKLNPMIMFYMLVSVILPALAITFMTVITSMINLPGNFASLLFVVVFIGVVLIQIMFLGAIRSVRPSLL